jgi:hypothetical protein
MPLPRRIVVETSDGADHSFHYVGWTVVDGAEATGQATIHSVSTSGEDTKVGNDTVQEIDRVGEDGLKTSAGTRPGVFYSLASRNPIP